MYNMSSVQNLVKKPTTTDDDFAQFILGSQSASKAFRFTNN